LTSIILTHKVATARSGANKGNLMKKNRRGGWPARTPEPGERVAMSFRVTPEFKAKLDRTAQTSGRSLAQEVEFRLERSFDEERHLAEALELAFDRQVAGLMLAIGCVMKEAERRRGDWLSDPEAFRVVADSIKIWLEAIDPVARPKTWAKLRKALVEADTEKIPELSALSVAAGLSDEPIIDLGLWISTVRKWLGVSAIARLKDRLIAPLPSPEGK
jgi:hypothetical protein